MPKRRVTIDEAIALAWPILVLLCGYILMETDWDGPPVEPTGQYRDMKKQWDREDAARRDDAANLDTFPAAQDYRWIWAQPDGERESHWKWQMKTLGWNER